MSSPKRYHTAAGSTLLLTGPPGGIAELYFDWVEEPGACSFCVPEICPVDGRLVWACIACGGGSAEWIADEVATPGGE